MAPPRWTEDTTIKFLELYKERFWLWDQTSDLYKNKPARESAMIEIVSAMNLEGFRVPEAKLKIKALRATYIGEVTKQEKSARSGGVYVPSLKWLHIMKFIMDTGTLKRGTQSSHVEHRDTTMKGNIEIKMEEIESAETYATEVDCSVDSAQDEIETDEDPSTAIQEEVVEPTPKRFKPRPINIQQMTNTARDSKALSYSIIKPTAENEHDIFGRHVAAQLKELSSRQAIVAIGRINSVLTECRLADIDDNASTSSSYAQYMSM